MKFCFCEGVVAFRRLSLPLARRHAASRTAIMRTGPKGKPFLEWCAENGKRGERLANEFREELPTELTYASNKKAKWKCSNVECKHEWRASVGNRTRSAEPTGCPKCANRIPLSKTNNFLVWCEKNGELGKKLSREYVDKDKPPTAVTYGSTYKALWKCAECDHEWLATLNQRTTSRNPNACPACGARKSAGDEHAAG